MFSVEISKSGWSAASIVAILFGVIRTLLDYTGVIKMRNFARVAFWAAATATISLVCGTEQAAILVVDIAGAISFGKFGDAKNTVLFFDIGANSHVVASAYSVTIEAFRPSYMSDMTVSFTDSSDIDGVDLRPGFNATRSRTGSFSGTTTDLVAQKRDFFVGADGLLRLEFSDSWDDIRGSAEGRWRSGTLTFTYEPIIPAVPEPATLGDADKRFQSGRWRDASSQDSRYSCLRLIRVY